MIERRAILRKPVDRIGFGGYLSIADKFPKFCDAVEEICDEFREIYEIVSKAAPVLGFLEALSGLSVDIHFISFADALGVDKELGKSMLYNRYNNQPIEKHFITEDVTGEIDYAGGDEHVYALSGTQILDGIPARMENFHVKLSANEYYNGRTVYMAGLGYNAQNARLLYRAMLWCAKKENELYKAFSTNMQVECNYYPASGKYALVNNSDKDQTTEFYDVTGKKKEVCLKANEIIWS